MAEERNVKARFEVEATGDQQALTGAADAVDRLAASAQKAEAPLRGLGEAGEKAGEGAQAAQQLGDAYESVGERAVELDAKSLRLGSTLLKVFDAFNEGYAIGEQFREVLASIDAELGTRLLPDLDAFIQKSLGLQGFADRLFGPQNDAASRADELRNILNILASKGIQPVAHDLEQLREQLRQVAEKEGEAARETAAIQSATEKWAEGLGLSRRELDATAQQLAQFVTTFLAQNQQLSTAELGEKIGPQIQAILDAYRTLGAQAPPEIQKIAAAFGVVDSATEAVLAKQQSLIQSYVAQLQAALGAVGEDARENAAAITEALKSVSLEQVQFLPPEAKEQFKTAFQEMVEAVRAAGGAITPEMVAIGNQVGLLLTEMAPLSPETERVAESFRQAGQALRETGQGAAEVAEKLPAEALSKTATGAGELASQAEEVSGKLRDLAQTSGETAGAVGQQGEAAERAAEGTGRAAQEADKLAQAQGEGAEKSAELATNLGKIQEIASGVEQAAGAIVAALAKLTTLDVSGTLGGLEQIRTALQTVETQARATGSALAEAFAVDGGGEGAAG